ncbi:MAG: T9SS type A sorting domain-containing protein [Flavobacteriales bacterium]|nr:T9SS type A sorting domain-containing protein [Flavobacteriales bacterium]
MKKNYALLSGLILASSIGFAQGVSNKTEEVKAKLTEDVSSTIGFVSTKNTKDVQLKAIGDTLYRQTFANQIPAGWVAANNAGGSNNWIWSNSAPGGQYSSTIAPINSTSKSDGFMVLPSDLYNTPFPGGTPVGMDATITSPAISIPATASVILQWEQSSRYCCSGSDELVVEVSTDNLTWTTYDAVFGRGANTTVPSPTSAAAEVARINVSAQFANQTTVYVRWRQTGATHYYWMIDDVMLLEGAGDAMELTDYTINFADTSAEYNPVHTIVPQLAMNELSFIGNTFNAGSNTQTGVGLEVAIVQDSTYFGMPGAGVVDLKSTMLSGSVPSLQRDEIYVGKYLNTGDGYYTANFRVLSAAQNQNPSAAIGSQSFIVSDTILGKDRAPYTGIAGPGNYVGGGLDGDMWATMMTIGDVPTAPNPVCSSISILVPNTQTVVGSSFQPRLWLANDTSSSLAGLVGTLVGSSPFSTTIDTTMLGTWITVPLIPAVNITKGVPYYVGWEQTGGASTGAEFAAARSVSMEAVQPDYTTLLFVGGSWGWVKQLAAVRINLGNLYVGIDSKESTESNFSVYPNPSNGDLKINVISPKASNYTVNVRNVLGQVVYTNTLSVNGTKTMNLDLSGADKGVYFVTLQNGSERLVKKVILK